jgi:putative flavoprotein involved in K+ transport
MMPATDPTHAVSAWLAGLDRALTEHDSAAAAKLFSEQECFWRDLVAFTWNLRTFESAADIAKMLDATLPQPGRPAGPSAARRRSPTTA